jgi:hypothetical protein
MKERIEARRGRRQRDAETAPPVVRQVGIGLGILLASLSSVGAEGVKSSVKGSHDAAPFSPSNVVPPKAMPLLEACCICQLSIGKLD